MYFIIFFEIVFMFFLPINSFSENIQGLYQNVYEKFLKSSAGDKNPQSSQVIDELNKIINKQDTPSEIKAKSTILLTIEYIIQNDLNSAYKEITKSITLIEKAIPQGLDSSIFSRIKSDIEKGIINNYSKLIQIPEFNQNSKIIADKINTLIEGLANYKKNVNLCSQKYRPILKETIENLLKENNIQGDEAEKLKKQLEGKYLDKIEKDGFFFISDLKKDISQYMFEKLFSN